MPTYRYRCALGHEFDYEQRISEPPLEFCPICAGEPQERTDDNLPSANGGSSTRNGAKPGGISSRSRVTEYTKKQKQAKKKVKVERLITGSGFILKGPGWAKDGYAPARQETCSMGDTEGGCSGGSCPMAAKT